MAYVYLENPLAHLTEHDKGSVPVTRFPWVIGRHPDCDLCIRNPLLSRHHCRLVLHGGEVWVQDLGSLNGSRLNGEPLTTPQPLRDGDTLILACVPFTVRLFVPADEKTRARKNKEEVNPFIERADSGAGTQVVPYPINP